MNYDYEIIPQLRIAINIKKWKCTNGEWKQQCEISIKINKCIVQQLLLQDKDSLLKMKFKIIYFNKNMQKIGHNIPIEYL